MHKYFLTLSSVHSFPPLTPTKNHRHKERKCVDDKKASVSGIADWNAGRCAAVILLLGRQGGENLCSFFPWLNFSANNNRGFATVIRVRIFMVKGKFTDCVWLNVATFLLSLSCENKRPTCHLMISVSKIFLIVRTLSTWKHANTNPKLNSPY